ncbi:hypothetical protein JD844_003829 [Phrynosoma platyrhinos]|uniref:RAP domain-containing protein n=1 Tax=Phrynosoma platyrhinos TaxID=52577 RepID=A0ABQ7TD74_PHRPL|nr:hypothetical protein JD844_003829 [Phrynosoma platyrhinos]
MATKLIHRWYRLYRVSSSLCVQTNAVFARSQLVRVSSQSPFALVTTCSHSAQTDKLSVQEQPYRRPPEHSQVDHFIGKTSTAEELLHLVDLYPVNANQAARIITRLSRIVAEKKLDPGGFLEDARFEQLLQTVSQVWNAALTNLLKSLYLLGFERNRRELLSVEQEVRWRLRRLTFRHLASLAEQVAAGTPRGEQSELLNDLLKQLELRWTEIEDTRTVGLEMAEQFNPEDTRKIAMALAHQNRRSIPLLRAISYHLVQKHFVLSPGILLDLAFAYGKLNFHQTQVFQKIASDLQPRMPELAPVDVYVIDNADKITPVHLSNIILAFARLNFHPSNREAFYSVVHKGLDNCLDDLDPYLLLDLVWSLCVLQQATEAHLEKVLVPEFHSRFLGAEMVLNYDNQPLPVADFVASPPLPQSGGPRPLPSEIRRLAFLTWEFPNFSNRSKDLLGRFAMARRHIRAGRGKEKERVPYYEWFDLKSVWQKAAYLRDKMNKAVAEEMTK